MVGVSRMFLGREFHSRAAAFLKLHWSIVDLALIPSIFELSLKLRSCSSEHLTKYPFSWRGQSMSQVVNDIVHKL